MRVVGVKRVGDAFDAIDAIVVIQKSSGPVLRITIVDRIRGNRDRKVMGEWGSRKRWPEEKSCEISVIRGCMGEILKPVSVRARR